MLKNKVKKIIYATKAKGYDGLINILESYEYISFDMFDTLIKRDLRNPEDIFEIMEHKTGISEFKRKRIDVEKRLRNESNCGEVSLNEIYNELKLPKDIMQLEIELEMKFCTKNIPIAIIYNKLLNQGKKIYITSDMYLPKETIEEILKQNDYVGYDEIYLSSDRKARKTSGGLFEILLNDNNLNADQLIHVGDAIGADYMIPKKYNIKSILIKKNIKRAEFIGNINNNIYVNILESFLNNHIDTNDIYEHFGYEVLGPILYSFTSWLHNKIGEDKIENLIFFARDAKIILESYQKRFGSERPLRYLRISRKAAMNAMLSEVKNLDEIFEIYKVIRKDTTTVKELLEILGLCIKLDKHILKRKISDLNMYEKKELFDNISNDLAKQSKEQRKILLKYLNQNQIYDRAGLIDVGWNASTQYCIEQIMGKSFNGYYYGVNKDKKYHLYESLKREGFLFDDKRYDKNQALIWMNSGLFELMFLTPEGTTNSYKNVDGEAVPILAKCEYSTSNLSIINKIQSGAMKFIDDVEISTIKDFFMALPSDIGFYNFREFSLRPKRNYIRLFEDMNFQNFKNDKLINNKSFFYYAVHPRGFYRDLMNNHCKVWFMRKVFKLKFPYFTILELLYRKLKGL